LLFQVGLAARGISIGILAKQRNRRRLDFRQMRARGANESVSLASIAATARQPVARLKPCRSAACNWKRWLIQSGGELVESVIDRSLAERAKPLHRARPSLSTAPSFKKTCSADFACRRRGPRCSGVKRIGQWPTDAQLAYAGHHCTEVASER